ncbi:MAG: phosphotransferase enzyme family protein [Gammaproteobacteria bacterium]|uniref:phosphotransferase enzyme family protein n=1 Tax=Pseudacidovorax sp. TaxID=1934311 RepID=UPI001B40DC9C|nr:phosphotransferase [Pseudacidovorax sp.]MBP6893397.1 phosphotransferase [Pseudacidovorax sp.]
MATSDACDPELVPAHTTVAARSVAGWAQRHYGLAVEHCVLIRRGLNDNYALRVAGGVRHVARLYTIRPRGPFNVDFETALLKHLQGRGVGVAAPVDTTAGGSHVRLPCPEGERGLALFHHVEGAVPDALDDFAATGEVLARMHAAARDYAGPPSLYALDGHGLAGRTLAWLRAYPGLDAGVLASYESLIGSLLEELAAAEPALTRVLCHGDTHGFNNHVVADEAGSKRAVLFDFDDAGPGFLAYDLGVMPWSYLLRKGLREADDLLRERWTHYLAGYRAAGGLITDADLAALPLFIQLRHLWNLGEGVGRLHHWGTSVAPEDWLRKQIEVMAAWKRLDLGPASADSVGGPPV